MKILVIQLRRIGDILLTSPVLRFLKERYPDATIDFLAEPSGKQVLETNPYIQHLHIYDKTKPVAEILKIRKEKYDVVLDFMANPRSMVVSFLSGAKTRVGFRKGIHRILNTITMPNPPEPEYVPLRKLRLASYWATPGQFSPASFTSFTPDLFLTEADKLFATNWLKREGLKGKDFVAMAPAHRHAIRQWRWEGFRNTALKINSDFGIPVYLSYGPGEKDLMVKIQAGEEDKIRLMPETSIREMGAIFKESKLVITNDSGNMHTAVAVGAPTITIYGPTRPIDWNPSLVCGFSKKTPHIAMAAAHVPCLGCHRSVCPIGHDCMTEMRSQTVLEAVEKILKEVYGESKRIERVG